MRNAGRCGVTGRKPSGAPGPSLLRTSAVSPNRFSVTRLLAAATGISSMVSGSAFGAVLAGVVETGTGSPPLGPVTSAGSNVWIVGGVGGGGGGAASGGGAAGAAGGGTAVAAPDPAAAGVSEAGGAGWAAARPAHANAPSKAAVAIEVRAIYLRLKG